MKIADSKFYLIVEKKIETPKGVFYIFSDYIISEINENANFTWNDAKEIINQVYTFYGTKEIKLSYISNRVNDYQVNVLDWLKFFVNRGNVNAVAIIEHKKRNSILFLIETLVSKNRFRHFQNLEDAISWVKTKKQSNIIIPFN